MILETILLIIALQTTGPDVRLRIIEGYKDVSTCHEVISAVKRDEAQHPENTPLIGNMLQCVIVNYAPKQDQDDNTKPPSVKCPSKKLLDKEVNCGKEG